jgi:hypothetical protein
MTTSSTESVATRTPIQAIPLLVRSNPRHFFDRWKFVNRETGNVLDFSQLWAGQEKLLEAGLAHRLVYGLKAGKLGFTEFECAFDAYRALFSHPHARVHILSKDLASARALLDWVRYGIEHLPAAWGVRFLADEAGGKTTTELHVRAPWMDAEDRRIIKSYASVKGAAIDQTAAHTHADEFNHLDELKQEPLYRSLVSTVEPDTGTMHIISRGAGPNSGADLFRQALDGSNAFFPLFVPWTERPRPEGWREAQELDLPGVGISHFAPEEYEDALAGEETSPYIPVEVWDRLQEDMAPVAVLATRRPSNTDFPAIRAVKIWRPQDFPGGRVDLDLIEAWVRMLLEGGCPRGHPRSQKPESVCRPGGVECVDCRGEDEEPLVKPYNVVQLTFDPYQLEAMSQSIRRDQVVWVSSFDQGAERLKADAGLYQYAMRAQLAHTGDPLLREHLENCRAKVQPDEESKLRIVKRSASHKIDGIVAASMAVHRVMELNLG